MLGHASAALTLDTYADLLEDDLDDVATRLNAAVPLMALPSGPQTRYARPQRPSRTLLSSSPGLEALEVLDFGVLRRRTKPFEGF